MQREFLSGPLFGILVFALVTAAVMLVRQLVIPYGSILIPALWGMGAILSLRSGDADLLTFGIRPPWLLRNLKFFFLSSVVVFSLYSGAFYASLHLGFTVPAGIIVSDVPVYKWILYHYLIVAFFEELFFRGYLQGRFEEAVGKFFSDSKVIFWFPVAVTAFLFALAHVVVDLDPSRMAVFFPGLLFGWLRARTGTLLAPILSHGSVNVLSMLLISSVS